MTDEKKEVLQTEEKVETTTEIKQEHQDEFWLRDSKDVKIDEESKHFDAEHHEETDEIDIAIVNEIAVTDDDPTLQAFSVRALVVGVLLSALSSSVSQLMNFKPVGVPLSSVFMLILAYVFCNLWYRLLPKGGWLNPGPLNYKEHTCIYVMVSSANTAAYGTYILGAQELYFGQSPGPAGSIFLLLATQLVGYGIAGQLRPFLVYPANMIWPQALPNISVLKTFNTDKDEARYRTKFFFIVFAGIFIYEFIPQYMFPLLSSISIVCLARRDSSVVQNIFGGAAVNEGMGIFNFSFDWNFLLNATPLVIPFWVQVNYFLGIVCIWIIAPLLYYSDVWHAKSYPFLSNGIYRRFDNGTSVKYPQKAVLNPDMSINATALEEIGYPQFAAVYAFSYIVLNFGVTATISHVFLFYGKQIWRQFRQAWKSSVNKDMDIHQRLMQKYKEVPNWWYYIIFIGGIGLNIGIAYANQSQLPWWGVIFAIALSTILSLPLNLIYAVTGNNFGLNVLTEMICGFIMPGYAIANMYFKTLGYNTMSQAGLMAKDLKIGHYLKVPPRWTFFSQMAGTVVGCFFNYIVNKIIVENEREVLLTPGGNQFWSGISPQTINSAAITWGAVGPNLMFGPKSNYYIVLWALLIGFFLPVPFWLLHKKFPKAGFQYVNIPTLLMGMAVIPGAATGWITVGFVLVVISQYYLKRRYTAWFSKYNYLLSAALDSGTSLMVFFLSMALQGGGNGQAYPFPTWAGNRADLPFMDYCCAECE
ncbi:Putative OPT family small oligopeptide transporter [Rhizopus microsporus]|nr:Putative OPT family small oligopeptide transporter [Rhizopus microsporus]